MIRRIVVVRWIIVWRIAKIAMSVIIYRSRVVAKPEMKAWFKIPVIIRIDIYIPRMIIRWYVHIAMNNYFSRRNLFLILLLNLGIISVFFINRIFVNNT
jgi:hypothetical protein